MEIPNHLKHKPIVLIEDYSKIDGIHANKTDAHGLTIGLAQWSTSKQKELSAKVWRYTGEKWSRQSEELPLHRVLDLASLLCASISYAQNSTVPIHDEFHARLIKNPKLLEQLKAGLEEEKTKEALDVSLKRLSKYLKSIGY
ncbi:DUF6530 family protein [Acinetobacter baumannii]|jgi:hypothetical protein|uniref:DUF6530 family protein n=1 Tax=Acinetobacter baumannii TaxID=470 RepID=UPI000DE6DCCB|nr:DUF6530 family protein [Acinetobacter baumannii]MBF9262325.1 hypothetical protein [Acinetobacter baumannii]MBO0660868.1 hypothetical protein [Acinetobacter baumannii]MDH2580088.1 DUF6530 family protein [Acinetobacter baumannii]MEB6558780.1 DUF6530 family protein [Acinetobacter baumannii]SSR05455.1 Uncharacterised protein [Acinetobacter baumannii]